MGLAHGHRAVRPVLEGGSSPLWPSRAASTPVWVDLPPQTSSNRARHRRSLPSSMREPQLEKCEQVHGSHEGH